MEVPAVIYLYRITHIANLSHILQHGLVTGKSPLANPAYISIGDSSLIRYRKDLPAPSPPGGTLADYIPFYLGPRQPMLLQIATGWEDIQQYPQEDIVYCIATLALVQQHGLAWFFTDGHARSRTSTRYTQLADLAKLDWKAINATDWRSDETDLRRKEKKQAEFLVKNQVPVSCIAYIGVYNNNAQQKAIALLQQQGLDIPVRISP
jgi:hypothetical protein